jgi:hypothetical protein
MLQFGGFCTLELQSRCAANSLTHAMPCRQAAKAAAYCMLSDPLTAEETLQDAAEQKVVVSSWQDLSIRLCGVYVALAPRVQTDMQELLPFVTKNTGMLSSRS